MYRERVRVEVVSCDVLPTSASVCFAHVRVQLDAIAIHPHEVAIERGAGDAGPIARRSRCPGLVEAPDGGPAVPPRPEHRAVDPAPFHRIGSVVSAQPGPDIYV